MPAHLHGHARRQNDIPAAPTGSGIDDSAVTVDTKAAADATALVINTKATGVPTVTPPPLAVNPQPTSTPPSPSPTDVSTTAAPTDTMAATSASSSPIAMSTVIGACVGAFIGAGAFILLALFFYRRYSQSLKRKANAVRAARRGLDRNSRADLDRRRSKAETWDKLQDNDMEDKWEGMHGKEPVTREVKEMDNLSSGLFMKSPSTTSHRTAEDSPSTATFQMNHPYATATPNKVPETRDLLGREPQHMLGKIDSGPPMSWASDSKSSFLSSTRLSGGAMSPTLTMAIPTPPAVTQLHRWESAEVINYAEAQTAEVVDEPRRSLHNPFFNAASSNTIDRRSRSNSSANSRSRSNSTSTIQQGNSKKERVVSIDPFSDPFPKPTFIHHIPSKSSSSSASNDRAIRQLVAAASLDDLSEDEVQRRLRVASMQPSVISHSGDSMYTDAEPDPEDMMGSFPVPPSSSGHETGSYQHR